MSPSLQLETVPAFIGFWRHINHFGTTQYLLNIWTILLPTVLKRVLVFLAWPQSHIVGLVTSYSPSILISARRVYHVLDTRCEREKRSVHTFLSDIRLNDLHFRCTAQDCRHLHSYTISRCSVEGHIESQWYERGDKTRVDWRTCPGIFFNSDACARWLPHWVSMLKDSYLL